MIKKIISTALATSLLVANITPTLASTDFSDSTRSPEKSKIELIKDGMTYDFVSIGNEAMRESTIIIDGVEVTLLTDSLAPITNQMLDNAINHVQNQNNPDFYAVENPGDEWSKVYQQEHGFSKNTAAQIESRLESICVLAGAALGLAGFQWGLAGAYLGNRAAAYITINTKWTITKVMQSYSSYYKKWLMDAVTDIYSAKGGKLEKTYIKYDVARSSTKKPVIK